MIATGLKGRSTYHPHISSYSSSLLYYELYCIWLSSFKLQYLMLHCLMRFHFVDEFLIKKLLVWRKTLKCSWRGQWVVLLTSKLKWYDFWHMNFLAFRLQTSIYSCPPIFMMLVWHYLWDQCLWITLSLRPVLCVQFCYSLPKRFKICCLNICAGTHIHPPWLQKFHFLRKPDWKQEAKPDNSK